MSSSLRIWTQVSLTRKHTLFTMTLEETLNKRCHFSLRYCLVASWEPLPLGTGYRRMQEVSHQLVFLHTSVWNLHFASGLCLQLGRPWEEAAAEPDRTMLLWCGNTPAKEGREFFLFGPLPNQFKTYIKFKSLIPLIFVSLLHLAFPWAGFIPFTTIFDGIMTPEEFAEVARVNGSC